MSKKEKEELERLEKRKKKIEVKYAKLSKKRLNYLNKQLMPDKDFLDLTDAEFKQQVTWINHAIDCYRQAMKIKHKQ